MKFYGNELSLVVCFTRIAINVPRIVINCFGDITSGGGMVPAAMSCQRGQVRWWASMAAAHRNPSVFIMKTRHCISGCGRVIHSGL